MSKNQVTLEQIKISCKHYDELRDAGMTENLAIRNLEQFANGYGKWRSIRSASPDHVSQYEMWSLNALAAEAANPGTPPGQYLRVEHGTPRRSFARLILDAFHAGGLTREWLDNLCDTKWRVAVITHEEDRKLPRHLDFDDPMARWAAAGIELRPKPKV